MRYFLRFSMLLLLVIQGCAIQPQGPETAVNLPSQLEALKSVTQWKVKGKMAVRSGTDATSASLNWKTDGSDFTFRLTNLLGVTLADMQVADGHSTLTAGDDTLEDDDPSRLIYRATGWQMPVQELTVWIKGLPLKQDRYTLNDKGLIDTLSPQCSECDGWTVTYDHYGQVGDAWLPHSLMLRNSATPKDFIKIRIDSWQLL